jgi:hypothetical protein
MLPENAAALVGAGMLSVLLFPMLGLNRLRRLGTGGSDGDSEGDVAPDPADFSGSDAPGDESL